ncbi:MAG: VWA domain-containing protein [Alphaproteobacteria bacterium]|nr:VWA domain-containing protein [Alphaproteobacteria bacterium]
MLRTTSPRARLHRTVRFPPMPAQALLAFALLGLIATVPGCSETTQDVSGPPPATGAADEIAVTSAKREAPQAMTGGALAVLPAPEAENREAYPEAKPNPVRLVAEEPVSTFSIDVDTASYAVMRRFLNDGRLPPSDAVRVEELVNYFDYAYPLPPKAEEPFAVTSWAYASPWRAGTEILHVGIKAYDVEYETAPPMNLVLLLDVSGSMADPDKLPLLKNALRLFVSELRKEDRVAIVTYAGNAGTVLEPTSGREKGRILAALDRLESGGSTAGAEGIRQAYALAEANFDETGVNRVILATDGDFNVGITDPDELEDFVARKRESGIYLTVLGFGRGNYSDVRMQTLAQAGNGNAAYIDTLNEARKVLVEEMSSTLLPVANDVKIQVEFNPRTVAEYRLIGYETRLLERADFNNDKVDAGEVGAGHEVTALYEIVRVGSPAAAIDPLRYGTAAPAEGPAGELAFVKLRYKRPGESESRLLTRPVRTADIIDRFEAAPQEARFAAAVAAFGQWLRRDPALGSFGPDEIEPIVKAARGEDPFGYRAEFLRLVGLARALPPLPALDGGSGGE